MKVFISCHKVFSIHRNTPWTLSIGGRYMAVDFEILPAICGDEIWDEEII